ncbi:MAG TPA: hypothetical protein VJB14_17185, partial [Planctomycetota bacterium]|nr:hypothetical protein [Planctomycetota bacterium]
KGKVTLESDPPGAEAILERRGEGIAPGTRSLGTCPLREIDLPIGAYRVLFRMPPYPEAWRLLDVRWGETVALRADLQGVPDERLKEVYEEVKTPFKHGIVLHGEGGWNVDSPCVFRLGDRWHMLYVRENGVVHETWLAESADLLDWKPKGRVLAAGSGGWDDKVLLGTMAFQDPEWGGRGEPGTHDGTAWISYAGGALDNRGGALSIGLAGSKTPADPASWTRHPANPVVRAKAPGAHPFEAAGLLKSVIVRDEARRSGHPFLMVYEGSDLGGARRLGLAGSDDLLTWTRLGNGPLFDHGGGISGRPQIVRIGDLWVMFYFGAYWKPKGFDTFACSWDLQRWTTWGGPDLVAPSVERSYDDRLAHKPAVVKHGGVVYHFYCGDGGQGRVIALATSRPLR